MTEVARTEDRAETGCSVPLARAAFPALSPLPTVVTSLTAESGTGRYSEERSWTPSAVGLRC